MHHRLRALTTALTLLVALLIVAPAFAQQPTSVNPTASSVQEQQLLRSLQSGAPGQGTTVSGRISIPDPKAANLIQPQGQAWRAFHQGAMHWAGTIAIGGMIVLLAVFYFTRGRIMIEKGPSGVRILRFSTFERFVHWMTAGCFLILALSGLNLTFGKFVLLPIFGPDAFTFVTQWGKYAHNYLAWPFMLGLLFMFMVWVAHNLPNKTDLDWIKAGGGLITKGVHPPAKKFNAGQKVIFWSVIGGGAALSVSGVFLLFPFSAGGVLALQFWNIVHGLVAVILTAIMIAHIYIGSVGMEGAADAMTTGDVDLNWAKEHHSLWVEEEKAKGTIHPGAAVQPAE
ncbi:MAG: formate dehydrogenase subunit gamma [Alphaproteobacteria bacterium]